MMRPKVPLPGVFHEFVKVRLPGVLHEFDVEMTSQPDPEERSVNLTQISPVIGMETTVSICKHS